MTAFQRIAGWIKTAFNFLWRKPMADETATPQPAMLGAPDPSTEFGKLYLIVDTYLQILEDHLNYFQGKLAVMAAHTLFRAFADKLFPTVQPQLAAKGVKVS